MDLQKEPRAPLFVGPCASCLPSLPVMRVEFELERSTVGERVRRANGVRPHGGSAKRTRLPECLRHSGGSVRRRRRQHTWTFTRRSRKKCVVRDLKRVLFAGSRGEKMPVCDRYARTYADGEPHLCESTRRLLPRGLRGAAWTRVTASPVCRDLEEGVPAMALLDELEPHDALVAGTGCAPLVA